MVMDLIDQRSEEVDKNRIRIPDSIRLEIIIYGDPIKIKKDLNLITPKKRERQFIYGAWIIK